MSDPLAPPSHGLVAGKYEIVGLIGRGGMGSVWEGRHATLGTRVAIKFIDQEHVGNEEARARFATEARAAATIQSRYAIQIFDHGVTDEGRPYIVMELLVGESLDKRLERLGRLTLPETARILGHVARALQRAHEAGIIHRDLKPENIFLERSPDDDEIAKVLDFGIAKTKSSAGAGLSSSTKTGAVLGTPYFMSPEQARGLRTLDRRSDLWSLGVIAFKSVTGVLPFEGESVGDLLVKICTAPPRVPSEVVPGLPAAFDAWFFRAVERDPDRRFSTATELADSLAYAAGVSSRRGLDEMTGREEAARRAGLAVTASMTAAGITSSPFTAPVPRGAKPRNVLFAILGAAVVGGSLGVVAVVKLMSPKPEPVPVVAAAPAPLAESPRAALPTAAAEPESPPAPSVQPAPRPAKPAALPPKPAHAQPPPPPAQLPPRPPVVKPPPAPAAADPGY
ncbi:MAG TPA: serine/threonine-protein kinase [Polyangiaceae bacterium]|jgi:serine/threonine-protein kinase